ncbi:MAG: PHP domain-containing protein [Chloroflexi bacterium]|nr:PHP domain-containing protein [Chloroflexota bacterium]
MKVGEVDLHTHSIASDGKLSPADVVRKAAELGVTVLSLCDHDSVDGIAEAIAAARSFPQLTFIPGVELSTDVPHGEVHILGYFIDYTDAGLLARLETLRDSRIGRARKMVEKLRKLGINIEWKRVQEIAGSGAVGRPHVAQAMLEKGYLASFQEAFVKYIGRDGPAYVEREKITPVEAVELVVEVNGLPVMAHPLTAGDLEPMVGELKAAGLVGLEAYYDACPAEGVKRLVNLAREHNLIATGGSDFHGIDYSAETMLGGSCVPVESAEQLIALAKQRNLKK